MMGRERIPEGFKFAPYVETMTKAIQPLNPVLVDIYEGIDITDIRDFKTDRISVQVKVYKADKIDKISISRIEIFGLFCGCGCSITGDERHALPTYTSDWDENPKTNHIITDLLPAADCGADIEYRQQYLDPLEPIYKKYKDMPGLEPITLAWFRALQSPYIITGRPPHVPEELNRMALQCQVDYLNVFLELWKKDQPRDKEYMKPLISRRSVARNQLRHNDPGEGPLTKMLGHKMAEKILTAVMG